MGENGKAIKIKDTFFSKTIPEEYHDKAITDYVFVVAPKDSINEGLFLAVVKNVSFSGRAVVTIMSGVTVLLWADRSLAPRDLIPIKYKSPWKEEMISKYLKKEGINSPEDSKKPLVIATENVYGQRKLYKISAFSESKKHMVIVEQGMAGNQVVNKSIFFRENKLIGIK